ncbi:MAG: hypothetical protein JWR88_38 [Pseudonocardia sp.]|nr:hypothetical protein [Pseudonocardia sp.]
MHHVHYRWVVLAAGTLAQASTAAYILGLAAILPVLREHFGLSLAGVGALGGAISLGVASALVPWGVAADRFTERAVMTLGLTLAAICLVLAAPLSNPIAAGALLVAAGAAGASVNAASGRVVLTWFPTHRRGLAMALRQTSVPVGAGIAALVLPPVAERAGVPGALLTVAAGCAVAAVVVALWVREPPAAANRTTADTGAGAPRERPKFADRRLVRLSVASALLVVPQVLGSTFMVELLHSGHGVSLAVAGGLLALTQGLGAVGRISAGVWSDRVGSRLRPLRTVALAIVAGFAIAAALDAGPVPLLAVVLVVAAASAISWNGLAFTAAGELAPPQRIGAALAFQNTANFITVAVAPAIGGAVAQVAGWPAMLVVAGLAAALAWWLLGPIRGAA